MDAVGIGAVRRLSVDVANLSARLAVSEVAVEQVLEAARLLGEDEWDKKMITNDDGHPEVEVIIRGEQYDALQRVLAAVAALG